MEAAKYIYEILSTKYNDVKIKIDYIHFYGEEGPYSFSLCYNNWEIFSEEDEFFVDSSYFRHSIDSIIDAINEDLREIKRQLSSFPPNEMQKDKLIQALYEIIGTCNIREDYVFNYWKDKILKEGELSPYIRSYKKLHAKAGDILEIYHVHMHFLKEAIKAVSETSPYMRNLTSDFSVWQEDIATCKKLSEIFESEQFYNRFLLFLKDTAYKAEFNPNKGKFEWLGKKTELVGLVKRLYNKHWIRRDSYTNNKQNIRRTIEQFFDCKTSGKIWQPQEWENNLKDQIFTFIK